MDLSENKPITKENPIKICFVCLGNICRSPTAEGIFQHLVEEEGLSDFFEIDSAGTSDYHVGESANQNSQRTANRHNITLNSTARQLRASDLDYFDLILAMDDNNYANILRLTSSRQQENKIGRMRDYDSKPGNGQVPDPYAGGIDGFENVYQIVKRSCEQLLEEIKPHIRSQS